MTTKSIFIFSILLCAVAMPSFAELTDADLDKIRLIVQEEIKPLKDEMGTLKTDIAVIKTEVTNLKGTAKTNFDTTQNSLDRQNNIIIACIGIPMAILAIGATVWGILAYRRNTEEKEIDTHEQTKELIEELSQVFTPEQRKIIEKLMHDQEQKIENLTQEVETLKQQRTVNP